MTQPAALVGEMQKLGSILPSEASSIIIAQATEIAGSQDGGLGLAAVIGILVSIYAASKAVGALIEGLHIAAGETDQRGFLASTVFVLAMTFLVIALAVLALVSTVLVPAVLAALRVEGLFAVILGALRWPIVGVATALGLGALYGCRCATGLQARFGSRRVLCWQPCCGLPDQSPSRSTCANLRAITRHSELWAAWCLC